jgi:hypothetical protein
VPIGFRQQERARVQPQNRHRFRPRIQIAQLRNCPRQRPTQESPVPKPAPKRSPSRAEAGPRPAFRVLASRRLQRLSSESHCLSRDPNLADRNHFDPLTRNNDGPLPQDTTDTDEKGCSCDSRNKDPEKPGRRLAAKEESGHFRAPQPECFAASGSVDAPLAAVQWGTLRNHAECTRMRQ